MSQRGYIPLDTPFTSVGSSRLSFGAFKGLGYSKVEPLFFYGSKFVFLCFGQTKTNQLYAQINSMSKSLFNLRLVVTILSCSRGGMSIEEKLVSLSL